MLIYPVILLMHLSDPTTPAAREVTVDYLGAGAGIEFRNGLSIEGTIGAKSIGCVGTACGRTGAGQITFTWRGRRHERR